MSERIKIKYKPIPVVKKKGLNGVNAFFLIINLTLLTVNIYYIHFIKPEFLLNISGLRGHHIPVVAATNHHQPKEITKDTVFIQDEFKADSVFAPVVKYVEHIVQKDQSLYSISRQYGVSIDSIVKTNSIRDNIIVLGQSLKIPQYNIE
nr:LysM peptidoglycan-binding domain-containing protein [uncultured Draconibacterium sp.]